MTKWLVCGLPAVSIHAARIRIIQMEAWMDPPLRHWRIQTLKSGRVSDGGEILAFDYAEAV